MVFFLFKLADIYKYVCIYFCAITFIIKNVLALIEVRMRGNVGTNKSKRGKQGGLLLLRLREI